MKKIFLTLMVAGVALANAQVQTANGEKVTVRVQKLNETVQLTETQTAEVTLILTNASNHIAELKSNETADQNSIKAARKQTRADVAAVLTPAQKELLQAQKKENRAKRAEMGKEMHAHKKGAMDRGLKAKRAELEQKLSVDEKKSINEARVIQAKVKELRQSEDAAKKKQVNQYSKEIHKLLKPVAANHKDFLKEVAEEANAKKENKHSKGKEGKGNQEREKPAKGKGEKQQLSKVYHFLLLEA